MQALTRVALAGVLLLAAFGPLRADPVDMSRDEIIDLAASGVGYSYWWGNGCWREDGTQLGSCSGGCPDCTHSGSYGADCSGFAAKVWQVPDPSPVATCDHPYSTLDFACDEIWWSAISRDALLRGDAATYRSGGCPGSGGHIVIYESGDPWGSIWTYEARGCSYGIVHNSRTLSSDYIAIRRSGVVETCTDVDGDGACLPEDCDDGNPDAYPGAPESCGNGVDEDCDGDTDEGCSCTDVDGDGVCLPDDCDDGNPDAYPGAPESCGNGVDEDCDGDTDEECCFDDDGDGFCRPEDCDDGNWDIHPGAPESCGDGVDQDCDGATDEDCDCTDGDGDTYCPPADCADASAAIHPGAAESCGDGVDQDCDGATDEDCDCADTDGDTYCPPADCDDANADAHPGARVVCAWGRDNDCDTTLDTSEPACSGAGDGDGGCGCAAGEPAAGPVLAAVLGICLGAGRARRRRG